MANSSEQNLHVCSLADERHVLLVQYILGGWISILIVLFGIFSNGLSILILGNQRMRYLSTNIYLLALSIVNLIWLLFYLFVNSLRFTLIVPKFLANLDEHAHHEYDDFIQRFSPYVIPLMNTLQLCSIYYTVAVSFDRFLYLSCGLQADSICTVRNALRTIGLITIFSILFILPYWFKYRVILNANNQIQLKLTSIGENELYRKIIHIWLYIPVVYAVPFVLLIFINFFTIKLLHKFNVNRRRNFNLISSLSTQNNDQHERGITLMLIGVVLLFFICRFPMLINHIFETKFSLTSYDTKETKYVNVTQQLTYNCRTRHLFNSVVNFLQTINASANLFFYYLFGEKFRETSFQLAKLVRKRAIRRHNTVVENVSYYIQRQRTNSNQMQPQPSSNIDQQQILILMNPEQKMNNIESI